MKIAVIGSRTVEKIDFAAIGAQAGDVIVSGGARGADTLAATEARRRGLAVIEFLPDYVRFGRGAPLIRNRQIVAACDRLVAFWDGKSRGTAYTIREARKNGKQVQIIKI